jgi:hypothetical protein
VIAIEPGALLGPTNRSGRNETLGMLSQGRTISAAIN